MKLLWCAVFAAAWLTLLTTKGAAGELPRFQVWEKPPGADWRKRGTPREVSTACDLDAADLAMKSPTGTATKCERVAR